MELIEVVALAHFSDTRVGSVSRKQRMKLPLPLVEQLEELGLVQRANPQAASANASQPTAPLGAGGGASPALSPAAQASPARTATSQPPKAGASSPSTTAGDSAQAQTPSTPATVNGGESMPRKRGRPSKASYGLRTNTLQGATA